MPYIGDDFLEEEDLQLLEDTTPERRQKQIEKALEEERVLQEARYF